MEEQGRSINRDKEDIVSLKRSAKITEELQKNFYKFGNDFSGHVSNVDSQMRSLNTLMESLRYDLGKTNREHKADGLRIEKFAKDLQKIDKDTVNLQNKTMEILAMHDNEFISKHMALQQRIEALEAKNEQNDRVSIDLKLEL